jgi:hypothetical protein
LAGSHAAKTLKLNLEQKAAKETSHETTYSHENNGVERDPALAGYKPAPTIPRWHKLPDWKEPDS